MASPSFTISRVYHSGRFDVYHYDFYRLNDPGIIRAELNETTDDEKAVVVVEWSGIVEDVLPEDRVVIRLSAVNETARDITVMVPEKLDYVGENL